MRPARDDFAGPAEMHGDVVGCAEIGSRNVQAVRLSKSPGHVAMDVGSVIYVAGFRNARRARYKIAGRAYRREEHGAGDILLQPAQSDFEGDFASHADTIGLMIPKAAIDDALAGVSSSRYPSFELLSQATFRSSLVEALLAQLHAEAAGGGALGPLYADTLLMTLVTELDALSRPGSRQAQADFPSLDAVGFEQIDAFIRDRLSDRITTPDLAALVDMPPAVFSRAFKKSRGMTPYQYILQRRIDDARRLIETSMLSLVEIAYATGFSSQSHMNDTFRSKLGVSPGRLRMSC